MTVAKTNESIGQLLRGIRIPSPPQIIADLQMEIAMPDPDLKQISELISFDAGLSGAILKLANSSYYSNNNSNISSIPEAVIMLGLAHSINIIQAYCLRNLALDMEKISNVRYSALSRFWDSATDVARVCKILGSRINFAFPEKLYSLGLFHNVGIVLLIEKEEDYFSIMTKSYVQNKRRIVDIENELLDTNHAVLSYYTARSWKLDPQLCKIIAQHHNTGLFAKKSIMDVTDMIMLSVLKTAEHIVGLHRILGDQDEDYEWDKISHDVLLISGLTQYELDDVIAQTQEAGIGQQIYFQ